MKLTDKSSEVFEYVKGNGGRVSVEEICTATGRDFVTTRRIINRLV